jgi:hypothetical protein
MGMWPASVKYLAADKPANPAPITATRLGVLGLGAFCMRWDNSAASLKVPASSKAGLEKSLACTIKVVRRAQRRRARKGIRVAIDPVREWESCPACIFLRRAELYHDAQQSVNARACGAFVSNGLRQKLNKQVASNTTVTIGNALYFIQWSNFPGASEGHPALKRLLREE